MPFCTKRCNYCGFFSTTGKSELMDRYIQVLLNELDSYKEYLTGYKVQTIYIGGGTPSLIDPKHIISIVNNIKSNNRIHQDLEVTIEVNPESIDKEKLSLYKQAGVNRISMGLQAAQDELLEFMGRPYNFALFQSRFQEIKEAGFNNINLDLIFGIPNQSEADWEESLLSVIELKPTHLSCYSLELDNDSYWGKLYKKSQFQEVDAFTDRKFYWEAVEFLKQQGFNHYEISNFAKLGFESQHNLNMWKGQEYIGIGAGAYSYFQSSRYSNIDNLEKYLTSKFNIADKAAIKLNESEKIKEHIMLSLRLIDGLDIQEFNKKFQLDFNRLYKSQIDKLLAEKYIELTNHKLSLTEKGLDLWNTVVSEFL